MTLTYESTGILSSYIKATTVRLSAHLTNMLGCLGEEALVWLIYRSIVLQSGRQLQRRTLGLAIIVGMIKISRYQGRRFIGCMSNFRSR